MTKYFYALFAFAVSIILLFSKSADGYTFLFVHPLVYAILYLMCEPFMNRKFSTPSLMVLFTTSYVRYIICPLLLCVGGFPQTTVNNPVYINEAILLMVYEEIIFFILVMKFGRATNNRLDSANQYFGIKVNLYFALIVLVSLASIAITPSILSRYHMIFRITGDEYALLENYNSSTFLAFLINGARYALILLLISYFYRKHNLYHRYKYVFFSLIIVAINALFVYDISRFSVLVPTLALAYLLCLLYPDNKRSILQFSFSIGAVALIFTSVVKMFSEARGGSSDAFDIAEWASTLQLYFMGQREVGVGILAADSLPEFGIVYFFNDIISNVMILSKYAVEQFRLIYIYNFYYSGGVSVDKIMPNIAAGYAYFGAFLSPVITAVFTYLSLWFDKKSQFETRIEFKFLYVYATLMCAFVMMQFYSMIVSTLINTIFVMYIIFKVNDIFFKKVG